MVRGMRWPLLTLCTAAALCLPAQAQVVRCTDARTGAVVYTDGGCASGTAAREVEPRKTEEEIRQERIQAAEALERKQQRLDAEATAARQQSNKHPLKRVVKGLHTSRMTHRPAANCVHQTSPSAAGASGDPLDASSRPCARISLNKSSSE